MVQLVSTGAGQPPNQPAHDAGAPAVPGMQQRLALQVARPTQTIALPCCTRVASAVAPKLTHMLAVPVVLLQQLAYTVYQPPSTFEACIKQWGVDSIQAITKTVPTFYANAVAYVMRVGQERLFVVFKGSDATNWMQNVECAHTEPLGNLFGAAGSDLRLHSGFYAGWKALEADVRAAVLSFAKEVRGCRLGNSSVLCECAPAVSASTPAHA